MNRFYAALALSGLLWTSVVAAQATAFKQWPLKEVPPDLRPTVSRADLLIVDMHNFLLRQLHQKIAEGGPAVALSACHLDVTALTHRIGRREGIALGFTSDRLRNPTNKARPWAADIVQANAARRAVDVEGFAVDLGDRVGVIRPIAQQKICASCHGSDERIGAAVRQVLSDQYPVDRAIGFTEGEIRGWYWVEMPKVRP